MADDESADKKNPPDGRKPIASSAATRKETPAQMRERLKKRFDEFDANGDGVLRKDEIRKVLTRNGGLDPRLANEFILMFNFDKIDKDGNGAIDLEEFIQAMTPVATRAMPGSSADVAAQKSFVKKKAPEKK